MLKKTHWIREQDVSGLATKTALTAVENKIPDVSSLVKKQLWCKNQWAWKKTYSS